MTSDQRLAGVRLKTERARQHIRDLENGWSAFSNSGPYSVGVRYDATTTRNTCYLTSAADVPADLALIAGDAIQNLRSALDHLAYQLVLVGKGSAGPFRHVYFPIADDAAKYENVKASQTAGMRPEAVAAIDAVKPYRSGNDTLWRLHALNLIDKHRLLVTLLARSAVGIGAVMTRELAALAPAFSDLKMPELYLNDAKLDPLKTGDDLYIDKPGAPPMPGLKFRFQLAIAEPAVVDGAALIPMLQEMATTAEKLTQDFAPLLR